MGLLTEEIRSLIGRETTYQAPEELGRASLRYFALAIGDDNPLYFDQKFAKRTRFGGIIAPPTFVCETNQYMMGPLRENGYIGHEWQIPLRNVRLFRGGNEYEFFQPVRPTDQLTVRWRIADIYETRSDSGCLLFVISEARFWNQKGELLAVNRETSIYQAIGDDGHHGP